MSTDSKIPGIEIPYAEQQRRALVIYEAKIRPKMTPSDEDKYVLIDILTGDYEIGENEAVLTRLLRGRWPEAVMHCIHRHQSRFGRVRSPRRALPAKETD